MSNKEMLNCSNRDNTFTIPPLSFLKKKTKTKSFTNDEDFFTVLIVMKVVQILFAW